MVFVLIVVAVVVVVGVAVLIYRRRSRKRRYEVNQVCWQLRFLVVTKVPCVCLLRKVIWVKIKAVLTSRGMEVAILCYT